MGIQERPGAFSWWLRRIALALCMGFFLVFGVYILIASFYLSDPFYFMMTFIASTLIILISAAILAGPVLQMIKALMGKGSGAKGENGGAEGTNEDQIH